MKSLLDIGVTAVRASSPEHFREVADGKYKFGRSTECYIQRPCHYCWYWQALPLLQFLWLPKPLWVLVGRYFFYSFVQEEPCSGCLWWGTLHLRVVSCCYRRRSNYASFLILHQNATFQTSNFQWCVTLWKLISYYCVTRISWLQKWTVNIACHRWYIKLRHTRGMAKTWLVVRVGNGNRNSNPMFLFTVWSDPRIPHVSKNMDVSCRRESNNGKRTRKWIRSIHSNAVMQSKYTTDVWFLSGTATFHTITISTTLLARFPWYWERSILRTSFHPFELVCNTHFRLSLLSFLHLALSQDSVNRRFLIMHHISNVAS